MYWYDIKEEYEPLVQKVKELFIENNIEIPQRIISPLATPDTPAEFEFITRMGTISLKKCVSLKLLMDKSDEEIKEYDLWRTIYYNVQKQKRKWREWKQ